MKLFNTARLAIASGIAMMFTTAALAETTEAPAEGALVTEAATGPALWKVADEDTTIYLFGTVHVLPDGTNWFGPAIDAALDSSQILVTELGPMEAVQAEFQQQLLVHGTLPEGQTLRSLLNEEQRTSYEAAMTALGLPIAAFDPFEPWVANINLSILPLLKEGYRLDEGVEQVLEKQAEQGLQRGALETVAEQIAVFDSARMDVQVEQMMQTIDSLPQMKSLIDSMVREWVEGDPDGLAEILNKPMEASPEFAEKILYQRNANWAVWIANRLKEPGSVFIAVGAGHLAGDRSVQDYLAERGISSQRIQ